MHNCLPDTGCVRTSDGTANREAALGAEAFNIAASSAFQRAPDRGVGRILPQKNNQRKQRIGGADEMGVARWGTCATHARRHRPPFE